MQYKDKGTTKIKQVIRETISWKLRGTKVHRNIAILHLRLNQYALHLHLTKKDTIAQLLVNWLEVTWDYASS